MKELVYACFLGVIVVTGLEQYYAHADPHGQSCECRELTRIRLLLEHQFGVVCDERHCEGGSSSGGGSSLP